VRSFVCPVTGYDGELSEDQIAEVRRLSSSHETRSYGMGGGGLSHGTH
jgi:hypothetical protein